MAHRQDGGSGSINSRDASTVLDDYAGRLAEQPVSSPTREAYLAAVTAFRETDAFRIAENWQLGDQKHFQPLALHFYALVLTCCSYFPDVVLALHGSPSDACFYTLVVVLIYGISWSVVRHTPTGLVAAAMRTGC
jgi:hypothetical protein